MPAASPAMTCLRVVLDMSALLDRRRRRRI
jgi:hypothetical protein